MDDSAPDVWFQAISTQDLDAIKSMATKHARQLDSMGSTGLMLAAQYGSLEMVKILAPYESGMRNPAGYTAMMLAAMRDNLPICTYLASMEENIIGPNKQDVFMVAVNSEAKDVVEYLSGAYPIRKDGENQTVFELAITTGNSQILAILLSTNSILEDERLNLVALAESTGKSDLVDILREVCCEKDTPTIDPQTSVSHNSARVISTAVPEVSALTCIPILNSGPSNYGSSGSRKESTDGYDQHSTTVAPEVSLNILSGSPSPKHDFRTYNAAHMERLLQDRDLEIQRLHDLMDPTDVRLPPPTYSSLHTEVQLLSHIFYTLKECQIELDTKETRLLYHAMHNFTKRYMALLSPCDTRVFTTTESPSPRPELLSLGNKLQDYQAANSGLMEKLDNNEYNLKRLQKLIDDITNIVLFYYKGNEDEYQPENLAISLQTLLANKTDQIHRLQSMVAQGTMQQAVKSHSNMLSSENNPLSMNQLPPLHGNAYQQMFEKRELSNMSEIQAKAVSLDLYRFQQIMEQKDRHIDELNMKIHVLETALADIQERFKAHTNFTKTVEKNLADTVNNQIKLFVSGQQRSYQLIEEKNKEISQLHNDLDVARSAQSSRTSSPLRSQSNRLGANSLTEMSITFGQPVQIPTAILPPKDVYALEPDSDEHVPSGYVSRSDYNSLMAEYSLAQERFQKHMEFVGQVETGLAQSLSEQIRAFAAESRLTAERMNAKDEEIAKLISEMASLRAHLELTRQQNNTDMNSAMPQIVQQLNSELQELRSRLLEKDNTIISLQNTIKHQRFPRFPSPTKGAASAPGQLDIEALQHEFQSYKDHAEKTRQHDQSLIQVLQARIKQQSDILEAAQLSPSPQIKGKVFLNDKSPEHQAPGYDVTCPNCAEITSQNQRYATKIQQLEVENRDLSDELDKSHGSIVLLRNEKEGLLRELADVLKNSAEQHQKDKLITDLNDECTSLTNRLDSLVTELGDFESMKHELAVLQSETSNYKEMLNILQEENARLTNILNQKSAVFDKDVMTELSQYCIDGAFNDLEAFKQHIADLKIKIHNLETDADSVNMKLDHSSPSLIQMNRLQPYYDSPSLISPYMRTSANSTAQLDSLQRQIQQLQKAILVLTQERMQQQENFKDPERSSSTIKLQGEHASHSPEPKPYSKPSSVIADMQSPPPVSIRYTPLMQAVLANDINAVHKTLKYAKSQLKDGTTALMIAVSKGYKEIVGILTSLEAGMRRKDGKTALHQALKREDFKIAQILTPLEGADISKFTNSGKRRTELMEAIIADDYVLGWSLLQLQAGLQDKDGKTALMYAAYKGSTCFVNMLKKKENGIRSNNGMTALMYAARSNKPEVARLLIPLESGLHDTNGISIGSQCSALMHACYNGSLDTVLCLLPLEATLRDSQNRTAMYYATHCSSIVAPEKKTAVIKAISGNVPSS